MQSTVTNFG